MSAYSQSALQILRKPQLTMQWYIVPLLLVVIYIVNNELKQKHYNVILGAAALWGMDLFNEIWNSIVFHATGFAPVWGTPANVGDTSLLILIGYNIEISFMFLIMGIAVCISLPDDKNVKILGLNNRVVFTVAYTTLSVMVECFLNYCGILTWEYSWWSIKSPWLIWLIGYLPFFVAAITVHDMKKRRNQLITVGTILGIDIVLIIIFGSIGWL